MAAENISQIYTNNPATSMSSTDLFYLGRSPFGTNNDMAITWANVMSSITQVGTLTSGTWHASIIGGTYGGTGVNNGNNTATYAGNLNFAGSFTTSGSFPVTHTYTGATNVTFPTSGTLATTSQIPSFPLSPANGGTGENNGTNTLTVNANSTINQDVSTTASPTFSNLNVTLNGKANNFISSLTSTASSGGTITLTSSSSCNQVITGSSTETIILPDATTLSNGWTYVFDNNSSGNLTIQQNGGSTLFTMTPGSYAQVILLSNSSSSGQWDHHGYLPAAVSWGTSSLSFSGTITNATWNGSLIGGTYGGTGVNNGSNTATYAGNLNFASSFTTSGAFSVTQTYTGVTNVTFPTSGTLATTSQLPSAAALTSSNDTNVTLTLGGTPSTALLQATSITAGWSGQLSVGRGGTGLSSVTAHNLMTGNGSSAFNLIAPSATSGVPLISQGSTLDPTYGTALVAGGGTGLTTTTAYGLITGGTTATGAFQNAGTGASGTILQGNGSSALPTFSTATYPSTTTANQILYSSSANVIGGITTANNALLNTNGTGVPSLTTSPTVSAASSGAQVLFTLKNTSNSSSSSAKMLVQVGGTSAGNPLYSLSDGTNSWNMSMDESNSQAFTISNSSNRMTITSGGQVNFPSLSCGRAYLSTSATSVTGDGTAYTVAFNATAYDQNSDFNTSTHTLTFPVTGKYELGVTLAMIGLGSANYGNIKIISSGNTYDIIQGLLSGWYSASSQPVFSGNVQVSATASDTATVVLTLNGGSKGVGVYAATAFDSFFWWRLVS